ncbi:MAG TPA: di-trans,poly-cis-decaprenylcistransferase [Candidatus Borkfalkia excrementigallinarum]|uniref:Isoprenyl transferase n=1 Tax=Candidatus Borkfalkia excrementigallinarum TaxID=2838506 RepID=A0A9D1ZWF0_9FIRM|nr:di-trans,poly-cis-decaprenylcistransferase [Candidatus Borkfalkia excrementigallinarum]
MKRIKLPSHVAIIMDGNGRWAKRRFRPRAYGHRMGVQNMFKICGHAFHLGIRIVTVFALSAENLSRPKEELDELFELFRSYFTKKKDKMFELNAKINVIGDISVLPADIQAAIAEITDATKDLTSGLLNICVNYGARQEIMRAVNVSVALGRFVDENSFKSLLLTGGLPDPDLIIRTGGELRLSNFLLYQAAYSELYFSNKMWPEFSKRDLEKAIESYSARDRRYGNVREG